jgi:uncharacterized protein (DUF58 family)
MQWLTKKTITKTYLIAILVLGMTISSLPQFTLAIALLILNLYAMYKRLSPKSNIILLLGTIMLAPLTIAQLTGSILSSLFVLPTIYLLDQNLQDYALTQPLQPQKRTREPTPLLKSTLVVLGTILAASLALVSWEIVSVTIILIVYFTAVLSIESRRIPKKPIQETKTCSKLLAGNTENKTIQLSTVIKQSLYTTVISLQTWVQVKQSSYILKSNKSADVEVIFTPPLAGPTKIQLQAVTIDTRGLLQTSQILEPIEVHVIPRAKYAQWLAKKYLEQTTSGAASTAATETQRAIKAARKGVEYYGNHRYQPGDRLKDVDWKHTYMLGEIVVKEYAGAHGQPTIIVADLRAKEAEQADELAYNMITSALTLATESLPAGLAVYNAKKVIAAMPPSNPTKNLKAIIKITDEITIVDLPLKVTQQIEVRRLKNIIAQLNQTRTEAPEVLVKILAFEYEVIEQARKIDSASQALTVCVNKMPPPAILTIASQTIYDSDGLLATIDKLKEKGYNVIQMNAPSQRR